MHKKRPKICTHYGVSTAKIYLYHSSKNASSRPPSELSSEYNSVQSILVVLDLACKIQVRNRPKIKLVQLDFSNSIFQKLSAGFWGCRQSHASDYQIFYLYWHLDKIFHWYHVHAYIHEPVLIIFAGGIITN